MAVENTPSLPSKCCAKCGFLYGLAANPADLDDAVFDPDLIRDNNYPPDFGKWPGIITSLPHASQEHTYQVSPEDMRVRTEPEPVQIRQLGWADTVAICCYKNKYPKFYSERIPFNGPEIHYREFICLTIPKNIGAILSNIRADRQDCLSFHDYHPGYTPQQHVQLELDERRTQRQENHHRRMVQYFAAQEKRLSQWLRNQDDKWERYKISIDEQRHKQLLIIGIAGVLIAIVVAVVQPLVEYFLPIIFGQQPTP